MQLYACVENNIAPNRMVNAFTDYMYRIANKCGEMKIPFTWGSVLDLSKYDHAVQDLTDFTGLSDEVTNMPNKLEIWQEIAWYNYSYFTHIWGTKIEYTQNVQATMYLAYLLNSALCYVEYPKVTNKKGTEVVKYEKGIFTNNTRLISQWLGETDTNSIAFTNAKYSSALTMSPSDFSEGKIKMIQLKESKGKRVVAKSPITVSYNGLSPMPLYMLSSFVDGIWNSLKTGILKFTYVKDNTSVREMYSTLNPTILREYYGTDADSMTFLQTMLGNSDAQMIGTDIVPNYHVSRGYIRLPELGISRYDITGCRALNLNRIMKIESVDSAPKDFINVFLDSVEETFVGHINRLMVKNDIDTLKEIHKDLVGEPIDMLMDMSPMFIVDDILNKVKTYIATLTTTYKKELHMYMINRPHIFENYTGTMDSNAFNPETQAMNSQTFGVAVMDF